ncbi:sensor domain-containing diguanylate cyclase [Williamsia sp. MIQD14]|uniref:sensor domain-containing diguanylate cyclase n=1 Tax=Williamsia sp. MIQD14 TaxID=3425703 RepID=UPI003DA157D4
MDESVSDAAILRRVIDSVPALIGYWDADLRNLAANEAYVEYFGLTPEQARGMHIRDVLGPEVYELNRPHIEAVLAGEPQQFDRTLVDVHGVTRYTQATYVPEIVDGRVRGFSVHVADVSRRVEAERARDAAVSLFETSMHHAAIGQAVVGTDGHWLQVNQALCALTGYTADELRQLTFRDITHPDDVESADRHLAQLLDGSRTHIQSEKRYLRKDGSVVWVQRNAVVVRGTGGEGIIIAQIQDITRRKTAENELARLAVTDALTGLGNRHRLMAEIDGHTSGPLGLLFLDLDGFKRVNDTYGHGAGDELLVAVARRIADEIDPADLACRIGGDEFVVLVRSRSSGPDIELYRSALKSAVTGVHRLPSVPAPITIAASVGSSWSADGDHTALLRAADEHMYADKSRADDVATAG